MLNQIKPMLKSCEIMSNLLSTVISFTFSTKIWSYWSYKL